MMRLSGGCLGESVWRGSRSSKFGVFQVRAPREALYDGLSSVHAALVPPPGHDWDKGGSAKSSTVVFP